MPPGRIPEGEPTRLGEYHLLEKLGHGGMAIVYRGERFGEAGFKKKVALKRMLPQYRRNPSLLERFAAEARTNARLDHPNLVQVIDFGIDPEPFLVLEFVEGKRWPIALPAGPCHWTRRCQSPGRLQKRSRPRTSMGSCIGT